MLPLSPHSAENNRGRTVMDDCVGRSCVPWELCTKMTPETQIISSPCYLLPAMPSWSICDVGGGGGGGQGEVWRMSETFENLMNLINLLL